MEESRRRCGVYEVDGLRNEARIRLSLVVGVHAWGVVGLAG